jgi:hypothetical protein
VIDSREARLSMGSIKEIFISWLCKRSSDWQKRSFSARKYLARCNNRS